MIKTKYLCDEFNVSVVSSTKEKI